MKPLPTLSKSLPHIPYTAVKLQKAVIVPLPAVQQTVKRKVPFGVGGRCCQKCLHQRERDKRKMNGDAATLLASRKHHVHCDLSETCLVSTTGR